MRELFFLLAVAFTLGIAGCDKQRQQTVSIALSREAKPYSGADVRLHAQQNCQGPFQSAQTSQEGQVHFTRLVEVGGIGVITDELSVCVNPSGSWISIFSSLHGPAPEVLMLKCEVEASSGSCAASFDGQPFEKPDSDAHDV
jgi:hypothetical protein